MIKRKLEKTGIYKKKLNKISIEIIRNLEILCFVKKEKIKLYKELIINKLKEIKKLKSFCDYLNNYLFKLNHSVYNYENLINYKKENNSIDNNKYLDTLYLTNNVVESINSKLNFYLPKISTNNKSFLESISKVLTNNTIKHKFIF